MICWFCEKRVLPYKAQMYLYGDDLCPECNRPLNPEKEQE